MNDPMHAISADDWRRSIQRSRARPNGVAAQIREKLAKRAKDKNRADILDRPSNYGKGPTIY